MSKRKATTDIHPDAGGDNQLTRRFKAGNTTSFGSTASESSGMISVPMSGGGDSVAMGLPSLGRGTAATSKDDLGTATNVETLAPKTSKDSLLVQQGTCKITPRKSSYPDSGPLYPEIGAGDCIPATMRSQHFLKKMAELNRSFANWINKCVKEDPTALLTRVFIDHQRHVLALFNQEKMITEGTDNLLVLKAQEKVVKLLKEIDLEHFEDVSSSDDDDDDSVSGGNSEEETSHINGPVAREAIQMIKTPSVVTSPNTATLQHTFNPFLNNKVVNGFESVTFPGQNTDKVDGVIKDLGPKSAAAVLEKPINFGAFSFASACSEAAAKAAAAKEQESEEANDDAPPIVEVTPVQEEGAVFTKRCKIFFKKEKEEGYEDRGIGNLFVKPVASTNRHQLIVRAETNLGNLLVNVLLSPDIPIKKMGQKDIMLVLVPTPGSGIRVVMVRVKDGTDEVVETLTKYSTL